MRREWEPEDLIAAWTLLDSDWDLIKKAQALRDGQLDASVAAQDGSGHRRHCSRDDVPGLASRSFVTPHRVSLWPRP